MGTVTSEQRILAAFDRRIIDRVPRYDIFLPGFITRWRQRNPAWAGRDIYDFYRSIDIGMVLPDQYGPYYAQRSILHDDGDSYVERDSWGRLLDMKRSGYFEHVREVPLKDKADLDRVPFGPPDQRGRFDQLKAMADGKAGRFCLVAGVLGLFMSAYRLRGEEQLLMDIVDDPPFATELAHRLAGYAGEVGLRVTAETGTRHTPLWVYDELASRTGPLISPRSFERVFLEPYRSMIKAWRAAGIRHVVLHCDGNSLPLLPLLHEAGFDGLQSLAPSARMDMSSVRTAWGDRFILIGGMCNVHTLPRGTLHEIETQARDAHAEALHGGVILGTHSIDEDVPVESYDHYCAALDA